MLFVGYDLSQVNLYISKLFENVGSLVFEESEEEDRHRYTITGVMSALGERLDFNQSVTCEGQIETWLTNFLQGLKNALQFQMATALGYEKPKPKVRTIRSAGSRKVPVPARASSSLSKQKEKTGSRASSRQATKREQQQQQQQPVLSRASSVADHLLPDNDKDPQKSWTLDHVAEIIYLATQVQMTEQITESLSAMESGNRDSLKNCLDKITSSINATIVLLKGLEGEKEAKGRREKQQEEKSHRGFPGEEKEEVSETASVAGARSSYGAPSMAGQSRKESMFDVGMDSSRTPIVEEEGSQNIDDSLQEPQTSEPIDTMNILAAPITAMKRSEEVEQEEEPLDLLELRLMLFPSQIQKLTSLLSLLAHLRDFMERMIEIESKEAISSFDWNAQLRYYFNKDNKSITVKCLDAEFDYGYEYIGSSNREVITPLTERVFISLAQAMKSHMGGMLVGSMDAGKFELVHELSRALGHPLYKFNCSKTIDYLQLQDIFRGMASTGCWICFDNFNMLEPAVLSVFAQLLSTVTDAMRAGKAAVHLQSEDVQLNPTGACFTLLDSSLLVKPGNPDKILLYPAATAKLPDHVMTQFRTVSVTQPDLHLSLEVMLCSQGFLGGRQLAKKTMMLYELCRKLLGTNSPISELVYHGCDLSTSNGGWSIKTLKGVISEAGAYLEKNPPMEEGEMSPIKEEAEEVHEEEGGEEKHEEEGNEKEPAKPEPSTNTMSDDKLHAEEKALVLALRDTFLPRLQGRDASIFATLLTDTWPHLDLPLVFGGEAETDRKPPPSRSSSRGRTAQSGASMRSLKDSINLNTPVVPLAHGAGSRFMIDPTGHKQIFVVGPAGCGKSECIKTFGFSERERGKTIVVQTLFTKAVESEELMGYMHPKNKEWKDGLLTSLLRKMCIQPPMTNYDINANPKMKVIQLDGEVDPGQMELLSAVLNNDGAVVLCNNERIVIPETIRFIWEMESVNNMSPAVLANVGILMMTSQDVGWKLILVQWLEKRDEEDKELLTGFCDVYIEKTIDYLTECCQPQMFTNTKGGTPQYKRVIQHSVENMITTFTTLFDAMIHGCPELSDVEMERYFNFSAIWAFAGTLDAQHRESFSVWWKEQFEQHIDYPDDGTIFDFAVDSETHEFVKWSDKIPTYNANAASGIPAEAFVHTIPVEQLTYLLGVLTDYGKSVVLVGENGCGKSAIINDRIRTVYSGEVAEVLSLSIQANRFTNARLLYDRLDERLEWKHGQTYVPKEINVDKSGQQTAVELVREHIDDGGFYNQDTHAWRYVNSVTYCSTINSNTTANVPKLSQRFLRHFAIFGCPFPSGQDQQTIFSTLLQTHFISPETTRGQGVHHHLHDEKNLAILREQEENMRRLLNLLVKVTVELQDRLRSMFLPTAQRCHYIFTLKDLAVLFKNLCLSLQPGCTKKNLMLLWQHECSWVYAHRMVSEVDCRRYRTAFVTAVKKEFTSDEEISMMIKSRQPLFSNLIEQDSGVVTAGMIDTRHSSNISEEDSKTDLYKAVFKLESAQDLMMKGVEEYNKIHPRIKLALYKTVIEQVCRLARTIASPHDTAHSVLISEGCPGRSTIIVKLAAHLCGYTVYQINPSSMSGSTEYKMDQFKADLVQGYTRAGAMGEKVLLLLHEEELLEEDYLVFLQEFIVGGSISHLFTYEEQTTIINSIRTEVTQAGLTYTRDVAWNFFLMTVRNNFRLCLIVSEGKENFQRRCREYPAFAKNVNFVWFPHWSKTQLVDHAHHHLKTVEWMSDIQRENVAHMLASMHLVLRQQDGQEKDSGDYRHITNTSYEKFVERFMSLATCKNEEVNTDHEVVNKSLNKIKHENEVALKLRKLLEHEMVVLEERKEGTVKILSQIGKDTAITEQQIKVVKAQLDRISKLKKLLPEYQVAHERAVYKAIAIVADTKKVIQNMDIEKLSELRGMNKPIIDIEELMMPIIMILKSPSADLTWQKGAKRQMANLERFIEELMSFDDNQLPESTLNLVEPYLKKPSFDPETIERKTGNTACGALCKWVRGVVRYHRMMISKVIPLHQKVEETTAAVDEAEHKMATLENKHKSHEVRLADLARGFEEATIDKNEQEEKTISMKKKLETAAQLRRILKGERQRCQQIYDSYERRLVAIPGGCAMAAAFSTYLGPYHHNFRRMMLTVHWPNCLRERGIPLVVDSIDGLKGRVIDWSIDFLKTASGASQVYDIDYTSALQNLETEDTTISNLPQNQQESSESARGGGSRASGPKSDRSRGGEEEEIDGQKEQEEEKKEDEEEKEDSGEEKSDKEKSEKEEQKEAEDKPKDPTPQPEIPEDDDSDSKNKTLEKIAEEPDGEGDGDGMSEATQSTVPMLTSVQYNRYVISLIKLLVGEKTLNDWLRKDFGPRQIENAAILSSSWQRPPMMIDPNGEGAVWLGKLNKLMNKKKLVSLDMETRSDPHVIMTLEKAIMRGKPVILRNCEEHIDNVITPLIHHRNTADQDNSDEEPRMIRFCGRRVLCHPDFHLFLSTPLPKPHFNPDIASTTSMINFGVSHDTLTEDLLTRAFARIRPELYQERAKALRNMQLEKDTLMRLSEIVKLNVLGNQEAMVGNSKTLKFITDITNVKMELATRLSDTRNLLNDLDDLKDELFPLARRAAMLFSIIRSLQSVHNEYQFSLKYFLELFDEAVGGEVPPDLWEEEEEWGYEDDDDSSVDIKKPRHGSTSSKGSKASATVGTTDKTTTKSEKEDGEKEGGEKEGKETEGEYGDDFETEEKTDGDSASTGAAQKLLDGSESDELPPLEIPETAALPTEGVEYSNLSANQIKQVMDKLTGLVYRRIRESLYEEDILLFATLLCLNIEAEGMENFSNEEMSLLLQGNPGLGMQLTLSDFDCKDPPPTWLPQEKWEDILALSVLPGPLDSLCTSSVHLLVVVRTDRENSKTPDLGPLSDFHQLLLMRMLRPDRLQAALIRYVNKHLTLNLPEQMGFNLSDTLQDAKRHHGVLLLLPPSVDSDVAHPSTKLSFTQPPVEILKKMAQAIGAQVESVRVGDGCTFQVDEAIDSAEKNDGWIIIEDLHLAPAKFYNELKKHLVRVARSRATLQEDQKKGNRFCVWITSEPCNRVPDFLLSGLHKLAWNHIMSDVVGGESSQGGDTDTKPNKAGAAPFTITYKSPQTYLHSGYKILVDLFPFLAIVSTLKQVPKEALESVSKEPQIIRTVAFGLGVIQGMLVARQLFGSQGLNQWYPFNRVQMEQSLEALTGKLLKSEEPDPKLDAMADIFSQLVYKNCVLSESDKDYVEACVKHVLTNLYQDSSGSLVLGSVAIPTPPANVDPVDFGSWYEKNVDEEFTLNALQLHNSVEKETNESEASVFISHLDHMFETQNMEAGDVARMLPDTINIMKLRSALDMCTEELPKLLELGHVAELAKEDFCFSYHRPSIISLATASSTQMPETIGYCLLQECLWLNTSLCHIRQQIHDLQQSMLAGPEALPKALLGTVYSLQEEHVPVSWIHPNCQPSTHSLVSWLNDTKKRYDQLNMWVKKSMVPTFKNGVIDNSNIAAGRLNKVWLGGLVNPQGLLVAFQQEKAIISNCSIHDVTYECVVLDDENTDEFEIDEGGLFITSAYLQGASWDYDSDCLKEASSSLYKVPCIYLKPVMVAELSETANKQTLYSCPVYLNKSRQVTAWSLNLNCPVPMDKWKLARTAIILDPGLPEDGAKKSRSYMMLMKAPMMQIQEEESIHSEDEEEELMELEAGEEITDTDANQSEQSQLSYRPISPKAPPLPPGLAIQREVPMETDEDQAAETQGATTPKKSKSLASDKSGKKDSVTSQKQGSRRDSQAGSPKAGAKPGGTESPKQVTGSRRQSASSPLGAKPGSRPPTRGSVTSKRSKGRERVKSEEEEDNNNARPRSEHEDPITQVEMETSEDERKEEKEDVKADQGAKPGITKGESKQSLAKGSSTQSLKKGSSTQSLKKGSSTQSLKKGSSTQELAKGSSTQSLKKGSSTQELGKGSSTQSLKKGSSTQSLTKAPSEEKVKRSLSPPLTEKAEQEAGQSQFGSIKESEGAQGDSQEKTGENTQNERRDSVKSAGKDEGQTTQAERRDSVKSAGKEEGETTQAVRSGSGQSRHSRRSIHEQQKRASQGSLNKQ
ncbi:hypothetical protein FSP39_014630 [Pinctada imbricata]|uniref:Uncharacterized protein n=1 Tax=Pinctada imbricata TaxID=66713 RepID=A0AA89CAW0_PINIB|nr:hypothetical protein FSP39_014630 [Pinctada imbricata]